MLIKDYKLFDTFLTNWMLRRRIYTFEELNEYVNLHPLNKMHAACWNGIGNKKYEIITETLKKLGY